LDRRKAEETFFKWLTAICTIIVVGSALAIVVTVIIKGAPALSLSMITQTPSGGYYTGTAGGGILNAIVGSLYLAFGATALAIAISLPVALFLQRDYAMKSGFTGFVRFVLDILWGVPSIVLGMFMLTIIFFLGMRASLGAGIIVLALLELPIMIRAMDAAIRSVPDKMKEASYALGATRLETSLKVVVRQALPGLLVAILLAFGRAIGDGASIMLTSGYSDRIPTSLGDPVASLPLAIFYLSGLPYSGAKEKAYAAAFILLVIVLLVSMISRYILKKFSKYVVK